MIDRVNHPPHYTGHPSGVECIQVTEHMNFCRGNAIKYLWRAGEKGSELEDLRKARWYIDREITRLENVPVEAEVVDEPEERWATWQEVPEGVHYCSERTGAGPWVNRDGLRFVQSDGEESSWSASDMRGFAPFVREVERSL